jgi:hypothetical protein
MFVHVNNQQSSKIHANTTSQIHITQVHDLVQLRGVNNERKREFPPIISHIIISRTTLSNPHEA